MSGHSKGTSSFAQVTADANEIDVEGTAVDSLGWVDSYGAARAHYMMRRARAADNYDEVIELFGEATVTEWLRDLSPNTFRLALAGSGRDEDTA